MNNKALLGALVVAILIGGAYVVNAKKANHGQGVRNAEDKQATAQSGKWMPSNSNQAEPIGIDSRF